MNTELFRELCLSLPGVVEQLHFRLPSFRVNGKILATLHLDTHWAMVKLTPQQQDEFCVRSPHAFLPVPGYWGGKGATYMDLKKVKKSDVVEAVRCAWRNAAPKKMWRLPDQ